MSRAASMAGVRGQSPKRKRGTTQDPLMHLGKGVEGENSGTRTGLPTPGKRPSSALLLARRLTGCMRGSWLVPRLPFGLGHTRALPTDEMHQLPQVRHLMRGRPRAAVRARDEHAGQPQALRRLEVVVRVGRHMPPRRLWRDPETGGDRVPELGPGLVKAHLLGADPVAQAEAQLLLHLL